MTLQTDQREPEDQLSPEESLQLIQSMINNAKDSVADNSFYLLFWGWLVFLCCITEFVLKVVFAYPAHYRVWWLMIAGGIITGVYSSRQAKKAKVVSFVDRALDITWVAIACSFFVLVYINSVAGTWNNAFTYYILLYAIGTFITGRLIQFKPLVIGGLINFVLAAVCSHFSYDYQLLVASLALLTSYIIPGHLLRIRHRQKK